MPVPPGQPQHTPRRRSALRRWIAPIACLLIGMVLSIVSGWVCVLVATGKEPAPTIRRAEQWLVPPPAGWPEKPIEKTFITSGFGWSRQDQGKTKPVTKRVATIYQMSDLATGFPASSARSIAVYQATGAARTVHVRGGILIPEDLLGADRLLKPIRFLPVVPVFPGFALNTLIYAALTWCILFAPGYLRRRRRLARNQCPACAYPIGTTTTCTECGEPVTPRAPTS